MKKRITSLLLVFALVLLFSWLVQPPRILAQTEAVLSADEQHMLDLLNQERIRYGVPPLGTDSKLTQIAREHSQEMINLSYFSHDSPAVGSLLDRIMKLNINGWLLAGENLAGAPTVGFAHDALIHSEKHKKNILNPSYTHIGIGIIDGGPYGKMFTQDFIQYANANPTSTVDQAVGEPQAKPAITSAAAKVKGASLRRRKYYRVRFKKARGRSSRRRFR